MTEQPPSAEALHVAETFVDTRERWHKLARRIDALIAQRVSAETERCAAVLRAYQEEGGHEDGSVCSLIEVERRIRAPAERPAPPIPELSVVRLTEDVEGIAAGTEGTVVHVSPGRIAETGYAIEFSNPSRIETVARDQIELVERPVPSALASTGEQPASPAAVGDYTERALTVARDAIEGVPSHLLPYRINSEEIAQATAPDIADALYAVASERNAALLARLQEPDVREAVAKAIYDIDFRDWSSAPVSIREDCFECADAAIAKIAEMLK